MDNDDLKLPAHYRPQKVNWKVPTLPAVHVPDATLGEFYRDPKVNWKKPVVVRRPTRGGTR